MPIIKYSLYELSKTKMKTVLYILLIWFAAYNVSAQSNSTTTLEKVQNASQTNKINTNSIAYHFNTLVISAYQEQAQHKIKEFYDYLNHYDTSTDPALDQELEHAIAQLLVSQEIQLPDFSNSVSSKTKLASFLGSTKAHAMRFSVLSFGATKTQDSYFECTYQLQVTHQQEAKTYALIQKVFLFPKHKQFGQTQKEVWELKLGDF